MGAETYDRHWYCEQVAQHRAAVLEDMNAVLGELLLSDELVENAEAEDEKDMAWAAASSIAMQSPSHHVIFENISNLNIVENACIKHMQLSKFRLANVPGMNMFPSKVMRVLILQKKLLERQDGGVFEWFRMFGNLTTGLYRLQAMTLPGWWAAS